MNDRPVRRPFRGVLSTEDTEEKRIQRRKVWVVVALCVAGALAVAWDLYRRFQPPDAPPAAVPVESTSSSIGR